MDDLGTRIDPMGPAGDELSFRADAVMPAQFYPACPGCFSRTDRAPDGEHSYRCGAMFFSVISKRVIRTDGRNSGKLRSGFSTTRRNGPFSFQCVCDALEIDPRGLSNWIIRWQKDRRYAEL